MGQIENKFDKIKFIPILMTMMTKTYNNTITETVHQYRVFKRMLNAGSRSNPWRLFFSSPSEEISQDITINYNEEDKDLYEYKMVDAGEATIIEVADW